SETRRRLRANGQVCARCREQGDVEPDGREMASVCRKIHNRKLSGTPRHAGEATPGCRPRLGPSLRLTAGTIQAAGALEREACPAVRPTGCNGIRTTRWSRALKAD